MTVPFSEEGGIHVYPGPRGFSVNGVEVSEDGSTAYFTTDQPGRLPGVRLPQGPRGNVGAYGDPGEARIRVDRSVGYRVFLWDTFTSGENCVYSDTGVWTLSGGVLVRRSGNVVTTTSATPATLPAGFRPDAVGGTGRYLTADPWPTTVTGTVTTPPFEHRGLEGYDAAVAQGFPGTAEQWMRFVYGVLPLDGVSGQYLSWTPMGPTWRNLPQIGPGPWINITLDGNWKPGKQQIAKVRLNNGTVEMAGVITYQGPKTEVGVWGDEFVRIGTIPPAYAPEYGLGVPCTMFKGIPGPAGTPVPARLDVNPTGALFLGAYDLGEGVKTPVLANVTSVNLGAINFPSRSS